MSERLGGLPGLSDEEVAARVTSGQVNVAEDQVSRTVGDIVRTNVFTRFNAILGTLFVVMMATGRFADGLFGFVLAANLAIGIGQELRAKRTLDRLTVLHAPTCRVRRNGAVQELGIPDVVLDDLLELRSGDQVPADAEVLAVDGLEIDESLLTGESDPVVKQPGDKALSGSFVVAGSGLAKVYAVGANAYARKLTAEAREFKVTASELRSSVDRILRVIMWTIVVIAPLVVWSQWRVYDEDGGDWREAVAGTVAALGGMIPEGLVLLTSLTMMVAAVTMIRRQVLVQELSAVEGLARVDVVCLDKTGTLTDGNVRMDRIELLPGAPADAVAAMAAMASDANGNATMRAIKDATDAPPGWEPTDTVVFSSARKWSATTFDGHGTWVVGAPEIVGARLDSADIRARVDELAAEGKRVLLLARSEQPAQFGTMPDDLQPSALCILSEQIRDDARSTLDYFAAQGVTLKIISGDNPVAVAAIASEVGLDVGIPLDARELPDDPAELAPIVAEHQVFGRVSPSQKRSLVKALQSLGHTVAMTGDGVNDTLALKDADIGVAMGSGASATRSTSQLVLMDDRFSQLPRVVAEGRRVINNIERVANLYLTKNVYSFVLAIIVALSGMAYPFLPRQLSLVTAVTYGIPSFFLALAPFEGRHEPGFLQRVLRFSVPTGVLLALGILAGDLVARGWGASETEGTTASVIAVLTGGLIVLARLARPLQPWKLALIAAMAAIAVVALLLPQVTDLLELHLTTPAVTAGLLAGALSGLAAVALTRWTDAAPSGSPRTEQASAV
jgi:cation-transporting ATPase E